MPRMEIIDGAGNKHAIEIVGNLKARTEFGVQRALFRSGRDILTTFRQQVLAKNKTGRIYIRKDRLGRKRKHQASASGESPANRTGFYRKSAGFNVDGSSQLIFGDSAPYAGFLELGTSRMKKRPGLGNAVKSNERNIMRNMVDGIEDQL